MAKLLFLTQRIPYPPIKGEKIRPLQILRYLRQFHDIHLGCLVDDPRDLRAFGDAVVSLLDDPPRAADLACEARRTVTHNFITPRHLVLQAHLLLELAGT